MYYHNLCISWASISNVPCESNHISLHDEVQLQNVISNQLLYISECYDQVLLDQENLFLYIIRAIFYDRLKEEHSDNERYSEVIRLFHSASTSIPKLSAHTNPDIEVLVLSVYQPFFITAVCHIYEGYMTSLLNFIGT